MVFWSYISFSFWLFSYTKISFIVWGIIRKGVCPMKTKNLCFAALATALIFAVTRFIQIPIPLGYFNVGNTIILLSSLLLPEGCSIFAGGVGSALADLSSYPAYTLPTLLIKCLMVFVFCKCRRLFGSRKAATPIAMAIATLIPLFGYTLTGMLLYGSFYTGLAQFPGLLLEYAANLILFSLAQGHVQKIAQSTERQAA